MTLEQMPYSDDTRLIVFGIEAVASYVKHYGHLAPEAAINDALGKSIELLRESLEQLKAVEWEVCIGVIGRIEAFLEQGEKQ